MTKAVISTTTAKDATLRVPSDKSLSHRSLLLGALAIGESEVFQPLMSDDCLATKAAVQALGVKVEDTEDGWKIHGIGLKNFSSPKAALDLGNSGTGARLLLGLLAASGVQANMVGDGSLSSRPMNRVLDPLALMESTFTSNDGLFPIEFQPKTEALKPLTQYRIPIASAQIKSCLLLAGLGCDTPSSIIEPKATRRHTEVMLKAMGANLSTTTVDEGTCLSIKAGDLTPAQFHIPADPSSAAFFAAFAVLAKKEIQLKDVLLSQERFGFFQILQSMGADITIDPTGFCSGEPIGTIKVKANALDAIEVGEHEVSDCIDELPLLALVCAFAQGKSVISGAKELRVKESDRIAAMTYNLKAQGVDVQELDDGWIIQGKPNRVLKGGMVESFHDHRIAMSFAIGSCRSQQPMHISHWQMVASSFPNFANYAAAIGVDVSEVEEPTAS